MRNWPRFGRNAVYEGPLSATGASRHREYFNYINERNPHAATEIVARIRRAAEGLAEWPFMGHSGRLAGTHEWVVVGSPYMIVYDVISAANEIAIIAVFHGAQDCEREHRTGIRPR